MSESELIREWLYQALQMEGREREQFVKRVEAHSAEGAEELRSLLKHAGSESDFAIPLENASHGESGSQVGSSIGPYELLGTLGHGGMGRVYRARQTSPIERDVAIKVIKPGMDSESVLRRFRNERRVLQRLDHPSIASVLDAGVDALGRPYIVMDLIDGPTLADYCRLRDLGLTERVLLLVQVCKAVEHAHLRGLLHRDIKPSNVLVVEEETVPRARVIDFGMAVLLEPELDPTSTFEASSLQDCDRRIGTLGFMSPEQSSAEDVDERSDVYSLGALLYFLLTDRCCHDLERLRELSGPALAKFLRYEPVSAPSLDILPPLSRAPGSRLRELDWVTLKALEGDPARRYATAGAMALDLERFLEGDLVEAVPPSSAYRLRKYLRRHRTAVSVFAGCALLALALLTTGAVAFSKVKRARTAAEEALADSDSATRFLGGVVSEMGPFALGHDATLDDLIRSATARLADSTEVTLAVRTRVRPFLVRALLQRGDLVAAEDQLALAQQEARERHGPASVEVTRLIIEQAHLHELQGDFPSMRASAQAALSTSGEESDLPPEDELRALAYIGLSTHREKDKETAIGGLERAIAFARDHNLMDAAPALRAQIWLAGALQWQGDREAALALLCKVRDRVTSLERSSEGDALWEVGTRVRRELGALYLNTGRSSLAFPELDHVIATYTERLGAEDRATLSVRVDRALGTAISGDPDGAIPELAALVASYKRVHGDQAPATLNLRANYLSILLMGGQTERVLEVATGLLEDLVGVTGADSMATAQTRAIRGSAKLSNNDLSGAVEDLSSAESALRALGAEELPLYAQVAGDLVRVLDAAGSHGEADALRQRLKEE